MKVRGQLRKSDLFYHMGSGDQIQVIRLGGCIFNPFSQSLGCLKFYIVERQAVSNKDHDRVGKYLYYDKELKSLIY